MSDKLKRILIITGFVVAVIAIATAIYFVFFKPPATLETQIFEPETEEPDFITSSQLPDIVAGNVNRIISQQGSIEDRLPEGAQVSEVARGSYTKVNDILDQNIASAALNSGGGLNYYDSGSGYFYRRSNNGSIEQLSSERFYQVQNVVWSPQADKAILEYPDGSNILYDFNSGKQSSLPKDLQDFNFSADGQQIAAEAIGLRSENNWIITAGPDGSNLTFVERLGDQADNVDINWSPNSQVVALYRKNVNAYDQEVLFIGQRGENFQALKVYGRGFEGKWTPKGDRLLYSVFTDSNGFRPTLWVTDAQGDNIGLNNRELGLNTWPSKCVIASDNITAYCGVPLELAEGSGIYPRLADESEDVIYRVNLKTGQRSLLARPVGSLDSYTVGDIFLSQDERALYFQDKQSNRVYSINLN